MNIYNIFITIYLQIIPTVNLTRRRVTILYMYRKEYGLQ